MNTKPGTVKTHPKKATVEEVSVSTSAGAKIQIVQYQYNADFHNSITVKYALEGYSEEEAKTFREAKRKELQAEMEPVTQAAIDEYTELRDRLREGE